MAVDARAGAPGHADLIFVFGTRLPTPAHVAADLYGRGLAPAVLVTGGSARQDDGLNEARHHRDLLVAAGVPAGAIVVEDRSTHTLDNVVMAKPLLQQQGIDPTSVITVVKRHHRRALMLLAHHMPTIQEIYVADYDAPLLGDRLARELTYISALIEDGVDPLVADGGTWRRTGSTA